MLRHGNKKIKRNITGNVLLASLITNGSKFKRDVVIRS